jgi:hypothetical protein
MSIGLGLAHVFCVLALVLAHVPLREETWVAPAPPATRPCFQRTCFCCRFLVLPSGPAGAVCRWSHMSHMALCAPPHPHTPGRALPSYAPRALFRSASATVSKADSSRTAEWFYLTSDVPL